MLKNVDWGGLTIINLLGVLAFPPYFVYLMTMAALTAYGFLYTTHLSEAQQLRLIEFEKEFRKGYKKEKDGDIPGALAWYKKLENNFKDLPQASKLAELQIQKLEKGERGNAGPATPKNPPRQTRKDKP
jgi:hypothetical protein